MNNWNNKPDGKSRDDIFDICLLAQDKAKEMKKISKWLLQGKTGISSKTMVSVYLGLPRPKSGFGWSYPSDPSDFQRCFLMLEELPFVREVLPRLSEVNEIFGEMGRRWAELEALYLEERHQESAPKLYKLMQQIRGV